MTSRLVQKQHRAVLVGVGLQSENLIDIKQSLAELEELSSSAGIEIVGSVTQILHKYNPATLIGSGKVTEIAALIKETNANLVIIDHQLSGVQTRNTEKEIGCTVLDRTQLILDR